jgi:hypothetical protein
VSSLCGPPAGVNSCSAHRPEHMYHKQINIQHLEPNCSYGSSPIFRNCSSEMLINRFEISRKIDFSFSPTPWETDGEASNPGPPGDRPSQPNPTKIPRLSDSTEAPHYTEAPNPTDAPSHRAPSACVPYPPVAPPPSLAFTPTPFAPERHQPLARSKPPNETPHAKKIKRSAPDRPTPVVRQAPTATTPLPLPPSPAQTVRNAYPGSLARKFPRPPSAQFLGPRSISAPLPPSSDLFARTKMKITAARTDARTDTPDHSHFHQPSSHSYVVLLAPLVTQKTLIGKALSVASPAQQTCHPPPALANSKVYIRIVYAIAGAHWQ